MMPTRRLLKSCAMPPGQHAQALQFGGLPHLLFGAPAVVYVGAGADIPQELAVRAEPGNAAAQHPTVLAIVPAKPELDRKRLAGFGRRGRRSPGGVAGPRDGRPPSTRRRSPGPRRGR